MKRDDLPPNATGAAAWRLAPSQPGAPGEAGEWDEISVPQALAGDGGAMCLLFLPSGAATPYAQQQQAEAWAVAAMPDALRLDLVYRGDRIIWTPQRVLVIGAADRLPDATAALTRFTWLEQEMRALENVARSNLLAAEQDVTLTHAIGAADLAQQQRVGRLTQAVHLSRIRLTRLDALLTQRGETLSGAGARLLSEMTLQAEFTQRLRMLDDQIEVAQDIYDTVNDRLTEFSHFLREYRIEVLIVLVLALEFALVAWDMFGSAI